MAVKKVGGSSRNGRDSRSQRLGIKRNHLQIVNSGEILIRQRGKKYKCGLNTYMGKDHTVHALITGRVMFSKKKGETYISIQVVS